MRTNDVDSLLTRLADDAVLMPPNQAPLIGKAAVRAWYTGFLSRVHTVSVTVADREVFLGDGWAVERASFEWVVNPVGGGDPITDPGSFMQVWQRQPDGRWLLSREVWNSTSPAPQ
jgi:ketosteroid isomerase-like protein